MFAVMLANSRNFNPFLDNMREDETSISKLIVGHFTQINESHVHPYDAPVITFSHFYSTTEQYGYLYFDDLEKLAYK